MNRIKATPWILVLLSFSASCASAPPAGISAGRRAPLFAPIHEMTTDNEDVFGNPAAPGQPFVFRIREIAGTIIPPHTHTLDENITVVQGTFYFAIGDRFDHSKLRELPTGSFIFIPKGTPMFGYAPEPVIVQIHGIGPFTQKFCHAVSMLSEPLEGDAVLSPSSFRFRKGDQVVSPRGAGTVRQGYRAGDIIEYLLALSEGSLLMAEESDLTKR